MDALKKHLDFDNLTAFEAVSIVAVAALAVMVGVVNGINTTLFV